MRCERYFFSLSRERCSTNTNKVALGTTQGGYEGAEKKGFVISTGDAL